MDKIILILDLILGTIAIFFSIVFIAVGLDSPFLAIAGLVIAPISIFLFNKKFEIKPIKYYSSLIGIVFISLIVSASQMPDDANNKNYVATSKQQVVSKSSPKDKIKQEDKQEKKEKTVSKKEEKKSEVKQDNKTSSDTVNNVFEGYKLIQVDGGNLSGHREAKVVVDIGFGDREYYAFTNEYGQLVKVTAKQIIPQNDSTEAVNPKGRYYNDEAKVPGTESKSLDEGHVIADSLGGVSNAYNITPQNSTLNRHGDQAYMEDAIRKAGGCTDFVALITYPDTTTQTPNHYSYTYTLNGNVINDEFDNINPDEYNATNLDSNNSNTNSNNNSNGNVNNNNNSANTNGASSSGSNIVYWTPKGKSYHTRKSCSTLSRSKTILEGTIQQSGKSDPCNRCH